MITFEMSDPFDVEAVADWIELNVALTKVPVSKAAISSKIEGSVGEEPGEVFMSSVWDELDTRSSLYGQHPPFIVIGVEVVPNIDWEQYPEYVMCLILSLVGNSINPTPTGKLFERVSMEAAKNYLNGEAIVFGHPARYSIADICRETFEKFKSELPATYNDRGVDVIAWKPFHDKRSNQIIVLMQCAGGLNWIQKTGDVVARAWMEKYITFGSPPTRGFSTVVVVSNPEQFEEVSFETDLLFDRPRIYQNTIGKELTADLRTEVRTWCDQRIREN